MDVLNRFKGLDLVDRMPEEPWAEIHNIVQEAVTKTIPKRKKCKRAKWLSEEDLQIVEERREMKNKGKRGRYTQLNAEFQRRARRDKKAFLCGECKEVEDGKDQRALQETWRYQGNISCKDGHDKGQKH